MNTQQLRQPARIARRLVAFAIVLLAACGTPATPPATGVKPGEKVGDVTVIRIEPPPTMVRGMTEPCLPNSVSKPGVYEFTCSMLAAPVLWLGMGWSNRTAQLLDDDWSKMRWTGYLDGKELDLASFGAFDIQVGGFVMRGWNVALKDPPLREYTIRSVQVIDRDLRDKTGIYAAGTYDFTFHVTVVKPLN